ncbi:virulence RhuM family protein [Bacteroidales bacterium OttesenSCG-928-B11]|nr:virulence RhuM family protein [Bacteroidales bacterium OttesenSCG-928-E04]MDL2308149.1 virulence RhuM family protein [Bacteroidales bacterium OttesenSCG-928-C03]MDL2311496.1 virulence RhuM family protein [Bacteroidales bacterium OttesenSCG-928-B11]MDL2325575.1 virulence RhuM family protein [Bacteroidales bacterium OttesenSCG-928-A14]
MKNEIILYSPNELSKHIEVRLDEDKETLWLTQEQIAQLFERDRSVITKHLKNIFKEEELDEKVVSAFFALTTQHGAIKGKTQTMKVKFYNLDAILSVGYRVNSKQGTQFRIWANKILKDYLLKGYAINNRMNRIEDNVSALSEKVNEIDLQINTHLIPTQGVFFDGQVFDAYELASKIIRSAKQSIILIDNYIDETTLMHLSKKKKGVSVLLLTKNISKQLTLDIEKASEQYGNFTAKPFTHSHDRFLILDQKEIYHLGASLKDLGRKWFAFSKMDKHSVSGIINSISEML